MITRSPIAVWQSSSQLRGIVLPNGRAFATQNSLADYSYRTSLLYPTLHRFEVRSGDHWGQDVIDDGGTTTRERSELSDSSPRLPMMTDIWVAYDIYIEPGPVSTASFVCLGQLHSTPDGSEDKAASPPWVIALDGPDLNLYIRTKAELVATGSGIPTIYPVCPNVPRGRWHRLVSRLNYDWNVGGNGGVQLWFNGTKIVDAASPLGYNDAIGPWFKFGVYRGPATETLAVLYNNIDVSLSSLVGRVTSPRPLPLLQ